MTVKTIIKEFYMAKEGDHYVSGVLSWNDVWERFVPIMQSAEFTPLDWWFIEESPNAWQAPFGTAYWDRGAWKSTSEYALIIYYSGRIQVCIFESNEKLNTKINEMKNLEY